MSIFAEQLLHFRKFFITFQVFPLYFSNYSGLILVLWVQNLLYVLITSLTRTQTFLSYRICPSSPACKKPGTLRNIPLCSRLLFCIIFLNQHLPDLFQESASYSTWTPFVFSCLWGLNHRVSIPTLFPPLISEVRDLRSPACFPHPGGPFSWSSIQNTPAAASGSRPPRK